MIKILKKQEMWQIKPEKMESKSFSQLFSQIQRHSSNINFFQIFFFNIINEFLNFS